MVNMVCTYCHSELKAHKSLITNYEATVYVENDKLYVETTDSRGRLSFRDKVHINYCPMCGRKIG